MKKLLKHKGILITYILLIGILVFNLFSFSNTYKIGDEPMIGCDEVIFIDNNSNVGLSEEEIDISVIGARIPENDSHLAKVRLYEQYKLKDNVQFKNKQEYNLTVFDYYIYTYKNLELHFGNATYDLIDTGFNHVNYTNDSLLFFNGLFAILAFLVIYACMSDDYYDYKGFKGLTQIEKLNLKLLKLGEYLLSLVIAWFASINTIILYMINDYYGFSQGIFGIFILIILLIILTLHILEKKNNEVYNEEELDDKNEDINNQRSK